MSETAGPFDAALRHFQEGRHADAETVCAEIIRSDSGHAGALHMLGLIAHLRGRHQEAVERMGAAAAANDANAEIHNNLGEAFRALGRLAEAEANYRRALSLDPDSVAAHGNLGILCLEQGRTQEAIESFQAALARKPDYASALHGLGMAYATAGRHDEALAQLRDAVARNPADVAAACNLASHLEFLGRLDESLAIVRRLRAAAPENTDIEGELLRYQRQACDWDGVSELWKRQRAEVRNAAGGRVAPWWFLTGPVTAEEQLICARNWVARSQFGSRKGPGFEFGPRREGRIRIGYVSADFYEHATAYLLAELLELHDRSAFEVSAYSFGPDDRSPARYRIARACDRFTDVTAESYERTARRIHVDAIDILVDLKGYTHRARPQIFAMRPAPVQVSYLGYPGTMGAAFIDYLIADGFVAPPAMAPFFSEKLVWLPDCYQINDRKRPLAPAKPERSQLGLPESGFVFCSFNNSFKITPEVFGGWIRMLERVPGSVLWLLASHALVEKNLREAVASLGFDPARLVFAPRISLAGHLSRHHAADLALDTFPCNGHTTTSDALWAGVPVLTRAGETFVSRVAGSLLHAVGLPELAVNTANEYEALGVALAQSPGRLAALRKRLRENRQHAPLFDAERTTRLLEAAYRVMHEARLRGQEPSAFRVAGA